MERASPPQFRDTENESASEWDDRNPLLCTYDRVLEKFMSPSLLVDSQRRLVHTFGAAGRYLCIPNGRTTDDLLLLLLPCLRTSVASLLQRVVQSGEPASIDQVAIESASQSGIVRIVGTPIEQPASPISVLLQFEELDVSGTPSSCRETRPPVEIVPIQHSQLLEQVERELQATRDDLHRTIQELQHVNGELCSTNAQLTESNDELQIINQEIQRANDELHAINSEHERKIAELTELTDDMDNLLSSIDLHILFLDRDCRVRRFTPGVALIFNFFPQDVGRHFDGFSHRMDYANLIEDVQRVISVGRPIEKEVCDDSGKWYYMRIRPYVASNGIDGVVLTLMDISSWKEAQARLFQLSEIVEHSDDAIYRIDLHGNICTWNLGATRLYGYNALDAIGSKDSMLAPGEKVSEAANYLNRIRKGTAVDRVETIRRKKNGTRFDVSLTVSPIRNHHGIIDGASIIARDITHQKQAEREIRKAVEQRDQFIGTLSHELRNPIAAILNANSLIRQGDLDDTNHQEARRVVDSQLNHVSRLLDDLLDVSRYTNGKLVLQTGLVDLAALMRDVTDSVKHHTDRAGQELIVVSPDQPVYTLGDHVRLQQAQVNLLVNASKYSPRGTKIWFETKCVDDQSIITVRDEGEGISAQLLPSIFDPFVQADQSIDRRQGGLGLGLPLVKAIADAHGGHVTAHSNGPGTGSEFILCLPLTEQRPQLTPPNSPHTTHPDPTDTTILLVEDNEGIRKMLSQTLQLQGFSVLSSATGSEGLRLIAQHQPQIAVVDIGLPDIDGFDFAKAVRNRTKNDRLAMISVTGYGQESDRQKAMDAGFDLHLVKPVAPQDLVRYILLIQGEKRSERTTT